MSRAASEDVTTIINDTVKHFRVSHRLRACFSDSDASRVLQHLLTKYKLVYMLRLDDDYEFFCRKAKGLAVTLEGAVFFCRVSVFSCAAKRR
jgi:hypothetical protein